MSKRCVMCEHEQSVHMLLASGGARLTHQMTPQGAPKHRRCADSADSPYPSKLPGSMLMLPEVPSIPRMDDRVLVDAGPFLCAQRCTERQFIGVLNKGRGSRSKLRGGHWRDFLQAFHRGTFAIQRSAVAWHRPSSPAARKSAWSGMGGSAVATEMAEIAEKSLHRRVFARPITRTRIRDHGAKTRRAGAGRATRTLDPTLSVPLPPSSVQRSHVTHESPVTILSHGVPLQDSLATATARDHQSE